MGCYGNSNPESGFEAEYITIVSARGADGPGPGVKSGFEDCRFHSPPARRGVMGDRALPIRGEKPFREQVVALV